MKLLFVYGSLKQGFANEHVNTGTRLPGAYRTRERLPLFLLGDGQVPCILHQPGTGHQVSGEVYEVDDSALVRMDRLERLGESDGYQRIALYLECVEPSPHAPSAAITAFVYVKDPAQVPDGTPRIGPLAEYTAEHARHFSW